MAEEKIQWAESIGKGLAEAKKTGKPVMMDFYTEWWGWCKRLDADTFTDEKVIALSKKFVNLKVNPEDADHPENEEARIKYGINGYPVVAFLTAEAELIHLNHGYSPPEEFFPVMENIFKGEEAFKELKIAAQKNPNDLKANVGLALIYIKRDNLEQGKPLFDKAVKLDPNNETGLLPELYANFALFYIKRGEIERGKPLFDKVVKLDPNNKAGFLPELYVNLALHYGNNAAGEDQTNQFQKAEALFQKVIDTYPDSKFYEDAQYYLGITYALQEKSELAIATLEKLIDAEDEMIRQQTAILLQRLKNPMQ